MSACSSVHTSTQSRRTAIEQLLLSEAVKKSFSQQLENPLPIPQGTNVSIDISGISLDKSVIHQIMAGWLGQHGYHVQSDTEKSTYQINVIVESLGTESGDTFVGIPPVQSSFIPISLPELALFKAQYQTGYTKLYLDIFELPSGRFVQSISPFFAETYYNNFVLLFLVSFKSTDLLAPPQIGFFRGPLKTRTNDKIQLPSETQQKIKQRNQDN